MAAGSPSQKRRLHALGQRADRRRLQLLMVDLVHQPLRLRDAEVLEQHRASASCRGPR